MIDALNVRVSTDDGGNQGVVKNIKGSSSVSYDVTPYLGENQVVGTYEHEGTNRFFVFVWNSNGYHSVYKIEQGDSQFTLVVRSQHITMTNNPLHISGIVVSGDLFLYFTDGVSEPQKINVDTNIPVNSYPSFGESYVMKKAPNAPSVSISTDTARSTNEIYGKSFQFALQYVYRDGEVSAIGEYSDNIVGLNTLENLSDSLSYKKEFNKITIQIGTGTLGIGLGTTIPNIRIFFKSPEDNTMYYIDEYTSTEVVNGVDFYNEKSYSAVADYEFNKTSDAVPKNAKTQTIAANRLFYANYKEGFDKGEVSAVLTPSHSSIPSFTEIEATVTATGEGEAAVEVFLNTENVDDLINNIDLNTSIDFTFDHLSIYDSTARPIVFYKSDGVTVKRSYPATDSNETTSFSSPSARFTRNVNVSASTDLASYNTNLAAALNNYSWTTKISFGSAEYDGTGYTGVYNDWRANFNSGSIVWTVTAAASSNGNGVYLYFTPSSFSASGVTAKLDTDNPLFISFKNKDYHTSQNGTFGALATDRYMVARMYGENNSQASPPLIQSNSSFKSGESHSFGVVFEDSLGRTTGVYEIGSVDVPRISERSSSEKGGTHVNSVLSASNLDSSLVNYFYVYSGGNNILDFTQYSTTGAYIKDSTKTESATGSIYIPLRALQGAENSYCESNEIDYKFTEGDKLRVLSYIEDGSRVYPSDIEFTVNGVETIESDELLEHSTSTYDPKLHHGQFLVLDDSDRVGWGYSHIASNLLTSNWFKDVVIEIYTPSFEDNVKIYRAISGKYSVSSDLGSTQLITQGNVWYRRRNLKFSSPSGSNAWDLSNKPIYIESNQYFDKDENSVGNLGGKPYAVLKSEKEQRRISSITYSDPQLADSSQNNLSSFNNSLANFSDYEMNYGGIFGLVDSSDSITLLQADKVSRVPVSRQILSTGSGSEFVTQSTDILGLQQHYPINAGINEDRTAFLKSNGTIYIVDVTRAKIVSFSSQGIKVLSDIGVSSFVEERSSSMLADSNGYFVSIGEDKENKEIIFSMQNKPQDFTKSIVYSTKLDKFSSFVSYTSSYYGSLGLRKFAFREVDSESVPVGHELEVNSTYGNFFGNQYDSEIKVSFNSSPYLKKVYQAFSIDGDKKASLSISTVDQSATVSKSAFVERENSFFVNAPSAAGSSEYVVLGVVSAENDPDITFSSRVNRMPFKLGGDAYTFSSSVYNNLSGCVVDGVVDSKTLSFTNAGSISIGDVIAIKGDSSIDGDAIRGAFAEVKFTFDNTDKMEIFSVSASVANSSVHNSPSSQQ
jgi:hypothetical protein